MEPFGWPVIVGFGYNPRGLRCLCSHQNVRHAQHQESRGRAYGQLLLDQIADERSSRSCGLRTTPAFERDQVALKAKIPAQIIWGKDDPV